MGNCSYPNFIVILKELKDIFCKTVKNYSMWFSRAKRSFLSKMLSKCTRDTSKAVRIENSKTAKGHISAGEIKGISDRLPLIKTYAVKFFKTWLNFYSSDLI